MGAADKALGWLAGALLALGVGAPFGAFAVLMAATGIVVIAAVGG